MSDVVRRLGENKEDMFKKSDLETIEDLSLHLSQLIVSIGSNVQSVRSIQGAYSTIANNTVNQRMKALTVVTILLAIPNVFYGMYGMNIALPLQDEAWAYPAITGFTLLLILLVFVLARRYRLF
jgi:Mg2+ and Co2+ transporter CorA